MDFTNLDFLYRNSPAAYRDLLTFMLKEFETAENKFKSSLEAKDANTFGQLKHKLLSTLTTLDYAELMHLLEEVNQNLSKREQKAFETEIELLKTHFRFLRNSFVMKIQSLREERVM